MVFPLIFALVPKYVVHVQLNWNSTYSIAHNNKYHVLGFQKLDIVGRNLFVRENTMEMKYFKFSGGMILLWL